MSAVADPPVTDSLVSQPRREVTYAARRADLRLVHTARYPVLGPGGRQVDETRGVVIRFVDGQLRLPTEGKVKTEQGQDYDAAEIIAWLNKHQLNGNRDEGFFTVPQAAPGVTDDELEAITEAAMMHDLEKLKAIRDSELAGWGRVQILRTVEKRIAQAEQIQADYQASIAEQAEEPKPAAKKPAAK